MSLTASHRARSLASWSLQVWRVFLKGERGESSGDADRVLWRVIRPLVKVYMSCMSFNVPFSSTLHMALIM